MEFSCVFLTQIRVTWVLGSPDSTIWHVWVSGLIIRRGGQIERFVECSILLLTARLIPISPEEKHHIYMAANSRISIAGLNLSNVEYVARAITECLKDSE